MSDINQLVVMGRLVKDPIIRELESGTTWAVFTLATNYHYKDKTGLLQQDATFLVCKAFGWVARKMLNQRKGDLILATGRIKSETWDRDGKTQSQLNLICEEIKFFPPISGVGKAGDRLDGDGDGGSNDRKRVMA